MPKKKNTQNNVMINEIVRNISSAMELFMTNLRKIDFSKLVNNFIIPLESFAEELEKAKSKLEEARTTAVSNNDSDVKLEEELKKNQKILLIN